MIHSVVEIFEPGGRFPAGKMVVPLEVVEFDNSKREALGFFCPTSGPSNKLVIRRGQHSTVPLGNSPLPNREFVFEHHVKLKYPLGQKFKLKDEQTHDSVWRKIWETPQIAHYFDTICGTLVGMFEKHPGDNTSSVNTDSKSDWPKYLYPLYIHKLIAVEKTAIAVPKCTCDTKTIFAQGCVCGFLKKRKFGI